MWNQTNDRLSKCRIVERQYCSEIVEIEAHRYITCWTIFITFQSNSNMTMSMFRLWSVILFFFFFLLPLPPPFRDLQLSCDHNINIINIHVHICLSVLSACWCVHVCLWVVSADGIIQVAKFQYKHFSHKLFPLRLFIYTVFCCCCCFVFVSFWKRIKQ